MPKATYTGDKKEIVRIKGILGKNVKLAVKTNVGFCDESQPTISNTRLKGIAPGEKGLIFTFENGNRHILEIGDEITISKSFVCFYDTNGNIITITHK